MLLYLPGCNGSLVDVVNHTFNEEQIEWFKHGSALNMMKKVNSQLILASTLGVFLSLGVLLLIISFLYI